MLEAGGLGAQIDKIAGAYRGNPEALQKKTKLQPDLMEALALQKVMSEKATAKQQLELSQQQDAGSVLEQMEQKLVGMNKEELTAQTAGIMGERNKKRNQQLSAAKPPQQQGQRPPMQMAQGAPQGLPAVPRPPTQFAAQGGIIGYDAGGLVSDELLAKIGITRKEYDALPQAIKDGYIADAQKEAKSSKKQAAMRDVLRQPADNIKQGITDITGALAEGPLSDEAKERIAAKEKPAEVIAKPKVTSGGLGDLKTLEDRGGINNIQGAIDGTLKSTPATDIISNIPKEKPASAVPAGGFGVPSAAVPAAASSDVKPVGALGTAGISEDQLTSASLRGANFPANTSKTQVTDAVGPKTTGIMETMRDVNPKESFRKEQILGDKRSNRDAKRTTEEDLIKEKRALDDKQLDPKAVAMERANAGIRGLIEGGTSRGASIARGKFDANVSQRQRDAINETIKLTRDKDKSDDDRIKAVDETAGKVFERESADRIAAIQGLAGMAGQDVTAANAQAKIEFDANKFNVKTKLDALAIDAKQELNRLIQENANVTQYAALLKQVQAGQIAALNAMYASQAAEIKQAEANVLAGTAQANEIKMVQDKQIKYMAILDMAGLHDLIEELRTAAVKGTSKNTPTDDPVKNAMDKYN